MGNHPASPRPVCLVTGAFGFLGRCIVDEFAGVGYRVVGIDRVRAAGQDLGPVALDEYHSLELPSAELDGLLRTIRPSVIAHAAGPASVADSMRDPRSDFDGTVGVLGALLDSVRTSSPDSGVIILSSAAVYGNPAELPIAETAPTQPVSPYGFHKVIAEQLLREYRTVYGIHSCAARVFSAYGIGLRRQLLWDVCEKARRADVVELSGTGDETRDFVHCRDVAQAVRLIAQDAPMDAEVYNVASGTATTIRELAETLVHALKPDAAVRFSGEQRPGDPLYWQADIAALSGLGFTPTVVLREGAEEYARWFTQEAAE